MSVLDALQTRVGYVCIRCFAYSGWGMSVLDALQTQAVLCLF